MFETFGSGVAWIDYDNDGFQDLFFVNGAPGSSNALYHNNHDGTFTDVTRARVLLGIVAPACQRLVRRSSSEGGSFSEGGRRVSAETTTTTDISIST